MSGDMNAWQRAVALAYMDGDFRHFVHDRAWRDNLETCGDTLFHFLMVELADQEGCEDAAEAVRRLERARDDLDDAIAAVVRLNRH